MNRPEHFSTFSLGAFFDNGCISVEQLNEYVRRLRAELLGLDDDDYDVITPIEELIAGNQNDFAKSGPTEYQVYRWFQESTIAHHIEEDGSHISKRAMFIATKAWQAAQVTANNAEVPDRTKQLEQWLRWCLDNCDDSPEWNFGTDAAGVMKRLLDGENVPLPPLKDGE